MRSVLWMMAQVSCLIRSVDIFIWTHVPLENVKVDLGMLCGTWQGCEMTPGQKHVHIAQRYYLVSALI